MTILTVRCDVEGCHFEGPVAAFEINDTRFHKCQRCALQDRLRMLKDGVNQIKGRSVEYIPNFRSVLDTIIKRLDELQSDLRALK